MRPDTIVVAGIGLEDLTQVGLAKDDDVIQAFSSDRADEPFDMSILPGRTGRSWSVPNSHGCETSRYGRPIRGVSIANEVLGCLIPREGLGDLTRDPFGRRMVGDAQRDQASSFMPQDDQDKQQLKVDRRHHKKVHGADSGHMVAQEHLPRLARSGSTPGHVLGDGRLSDLDPKLQKIRRGCEVLPRAGSPRSSAGSGYGPQPEPWADRRANATSSANKSGTPLGAIARSYPVG